MVVILFAHMDCVDAFAHLPPVCCRAVTICDRDDLAVVTDFLTDLMVALRCTFFRMSGSGFFI